MAATAILIVIAVAFTVFLFVQGHRTASGDPQYVALGSSFAAGAGLGPLQSGSPLICARSVNGYPQRLARIMKLSIVDMSCGGATAKHVLSGGQFFQGPQLRVVDRRTRLVTITVGGNDVSYIGDLSLLASRNSGTVFGSFVRHFWSGPKLPHERDYAVLQRELVSIVRMIRDRAPNSTVLLVSYPTILPPSGTCARLRLSGSEADLMRDVAQHLAAATRSAAEFSGASLVDMHVIGRAHNACSNDPWTRGWTNGGIAPFHPTLRGAQATAEAIASVLHPSPASIAPVRQDDASGHQARGV